MSRNAGAALERMEDGFCTFGRFGSDFVPPLSLVMDRRGIYFDPSLRSDLEEILNGRLFSSEDLVRARRVRSWSRAEGDHEIQRRAPSEGPMAANGTRGSTRTGTGGG